VILLGLGSNLPTAAGDPRRTIAAALEALEGSGLEVLHCSPFYTTAPMGVDDQPWFVNAVARLRADGAPEVLLAQLHETEAAFGRRRTRRWDARALDLDLLDWEGTVRPDLARWRRAAESDAAPPYLVLPHPRLHRRRFVLEPLADIAADWRHPVLDETAGELLATVADQPVLRLA